MNLSASEIRVLACLLEKQRTTPDMYPLTLNALRMACNQSTNRDPIVDYDDEAIREALHRLERRGLTRLASGRGSRAPKYRHLLADVMPMGSDEQAIMSVLMLRGPQTPGELKLRAERMHPFGGLDAVHETLARLIGRGLAVRLERRPGQKEERYVQLLEDPADPGSAEEGPPLRSAAGDGASALPPVSPAGSVPAANALAALHERVERLEREVADLRAAQGAAEQGAADPSLRAGCPSGEHAGVST